MSAGEYNFGAGSQTDDLCLAIIKRLGEMIESNTGTNPDAEFNYEFKASDYNYGNRSQTDDLLEEILNRLNNIGGGGGGGGTDTNLGNSNLQADAVRKYDIVSHALQIVAGSSQIVEFSAGRFFVGKSGLVYRFPDEKVGEQGVALVTDSSGNLTWRKLTSDDVVVFGGQTTDWANRQTLIMGASPVGDLVAPALETLNDMTVNAMDCHKIAFQNNDAHIDNIVRYEVQIYMDGALAPTPQARFVIGVASRANNSSQLVFTKFQTASVNIQTLNKRLFYLTGNLAYSHSPNDIVVFGLYNPNSTDFNVQGIVAFNAKLAFSHPVNDTPV